MPLPTKSLFEQEAPDIGTQNGVQSNEVLQGAHQGGHATARFLEGFLEGSLTEVPS